MAIVGRSLCVYIFNTSACCFYGTPMLIETRSHGLGQHLHITHEIS